VVLGRPSDGRVGRARVAAPEDEGSHDAVRALPLTGTSAGRPRRLSRGCRTGAIRAAPVPRSPAGHGSWA